MDETTRSAAFIGSVGIPNRYGGFESFLESCGPELAQRLGLMVVTCDAKAYEEHCPNYRGIQRRFIRVRANGAASILHDLVAFLAVFRSIQCIVVLGVSGGPWFPLWRFLCWVSGKRLIVNIDGLEWRRAKFGPYARLGLRLFGWLAQAFADRVIVDSKALLPHVPARFRAKTVRIAYAGDHVLEYPRTAQIRGTALTVCRIEAENNVEMMILGVLRSDIAEYTLIGNWSHGSYGRELLRRFGKEKRLKLIDSIYDASRLNEFRSSCWFYLHGNSVGGTNPSLVEMLFYEAKILCFDCAFNRETAGHCAQYFAGSDELALKMVNTLAPPVELAAVRSMYTRKRIAKEYIEAMFS